MSATDSNSVFDQLLGSWSFVREVPDQALMTGCAFVSLLQQDMALYHESARIVLATGDVLHGQQRYLHRRPPAPGNSLAVLFYETRELFHELHFAVGSDGALRARSLHACNEDTYGSEYTLFHNGSFHVRHTVRGPRKNYTVSTIYQRAGKPD